MPPIVLCSMNEAVRKRWQDCLEGKDVLHVAQISDLENLDLANVPDLILLHRTMATAQILSQISQTVPQGKIFLLSDRPDEVEGLDFLKRGIVGYANTYISPTRLHEAVRVILNGSVWVGQAVMQRLINEAVSSRSNVSRQISSRPPLGKLTARENEIAEMVAQGNSNLEIACDWNISERTVKAHLSSIYAKTKTGNRLNLALLVNQETSNEIGTKWN